MKLYLLFLGFISLPLASMELMQADQKGKEEKPAAARRLLPREMCAKIAVIKTMENPVTAQCEKSMPWRDDFADETQIYSKTWLTTKMVPHALFENQLWCKNKDTALKLRFDNDTTHDCNVFKLNDLGTKHLIGFDGPNNDGDAEHQVEGCHHGVILIGHSYRTPPGAYQSVIHLFKQHGVSAQEYQGVQKKIQTTFGHMFALAYQGFPYTSAPLLGHKIYFCAIASKNRGAVATVDEADNHHLQVFDYMCDKNDTAGEPDQSFTTNVVAKADGTPDFKRLAWLYGKTLLGLSKQHELYVLTVDDKNSSITCHKQKTDRKFKDFALARPYCHHEMVLVSEDNQLYYANLKSHDSHRHKGFLYTKILDTVRESNKKAKKDHNEPRISRSQIDRVWIYGDLIGLKQADASTGQVVEDSAYGIISGFINFLSLRQACVSAVDIENQIAELAKPVQNKEVESIVEKKRKQEDKKGE
ncbi:hypothetical protein BH09DEP1_BH09DEP1_4180 [soil metagenome]